MNVTGYTPKAWALAFPQQAWFWHVAPIAKRLVLQAWRAKDPPEIQLWVAEMVD